MTSGYPNLIAAFRDVAEARGDDNGVHFYSSPSQSSYLSYRDLDRQSRAIASSLTARGLVPGDVVVIALNSDLDYIGALFGALYAGLAISPAVATGSAAPDVIAHRIAVIAEASGAQLIITQDSVLTALAEPIEAGVFGDLSAVTVTELLHAGDPDAWSEPAIEPSGLAGLFFTSGSTGNPKGVIFTHETLIAGIEMCRQVTHFDHETVLVGWMPFHHAWGMIMELLMPAYFGTKVVLTSTAQFQRRPVFWLQLISEHRATMSIGADFAFGLCAQFATDEQVAALDLSSLTVLMSGGEPVREATVDSFVERFGPAGLHRDSIMPVLGMTEAMLITAKPVGEKLTVLKADAGALEAGQLSKAGGDRAIELVSCGRPGPGCSVAIVDPQTGIRMDDGQVGEIWVSSPAVTPGYWRNPEATAETFGARLESEAAGYLRTGDLGAMLDGELFVTGRVKDLIIVRGRNIYPQDIEAAANRIHPSVRLAAAFELTEHPSDVGIVVEYDPEHIADDDDALQKLSAQLRSQLVSEFSLPSLAIALVRLGDLPLTQSGKVRRSFSRSAIERGDLVVAYADGFARVH
jgi:acyl-CoA synthetase (AMP-forming)/AMP-acid ligase II